MSALLFLKDPHRNEVCRGDSFRGLLWPLLISIFLHVAALGDLVSGRLASSSIQPVEQVHNVPTMLSVRLVSKPQREMLLPQSAQVAVQQNIRKKTEISRSTAKNAIKSRKPSVAGLSEKEGDVPVIDEMEAAQYRLALARTLARLRTEEGIAPLGAGEISLELLGQVGGRSEPLLKLQKHSMGPDTSAQWQLLVQAAIDQTPLPMAWSGRSFKLSLTLQFGSIQSAQGSACNSCS